MASGPTVNINGNLNINPASVRQSASQVQSAFNNLRINPQSLNKFNNSLGRITGSASEFQKSMDAATARVFAFGATAAVIQTINQSFKALISSTIQVEKRLTEINSILGASEQQFSKFRKSIFDVAKNTEQSFSIVADGAAELARQGLNAEETAKRLNAALVLTRISGLDSVSSVNALTAAINGYTSAALSAETIVNKLVAVDTAFAVSAKDLADGFQRAGSTAEDAGVSFDELLGLITAVQQKTARGGAVIGNAFKSIFTRLSRSTTISELQNLGVQIDASQSGAQKLEALANSLDKVADPTKASKIKELAGGVFQINVVSAALKDLSSETSLFAQASEIAANASTEAFDKNAKLNVTLSSQINSLVVGLTNVAEKVGSITLAPVISDLVGIASKITDFLDGALNEEKGFSITQGLFNGIATFIKGPGLILMTGAFLNIFKIVSKFAIQGFKDLTTLGNGQQKIKTIEQGIVDLLTRDATLRQQLSNTTLTQAQREQLVLDAIKKENQLLRDQQALIASLAAASARAGVGGYAPNTGFKGKKGRGFAAGYTPEDGMMEVMEAVSLGASPSVKPKMGQGTIGGRKFLMNSQEVEIPNFGMNGDSAVIPLYAKGHIPRYALGKNPTQISKMSASALSTFMGTKKFQDVGRGSNQSDRSAKAAALRRKRELDKNISAAPLGSPENRIPINANQYGYLTPRIRASSSKSRNGRFEIGKSAYSYSMKNVNVRGPLIPDKVDEAADPQDEQLKKNIEKSVLDSSLRFARLISPNNSNLKTNTVVAKGLRQNRGAKGAIAAAVGSAFEVATSSALNIKEAAVDKKRGDFDVRLPKGSEKGKKLKTLFNLPNDPTLMEFKTSSSTNNLDSFAKKIFNERGGIKGFGGSAPKGLSANKRKASGHLPRYAKGKPRKLPPPLPSSPSQGSTSNSGSFGTKAFIGSIAVSTIGGFVQQGSQSSSQKEIDKLNKSLEALESKLKNIDKAKTPDVFKETSDNAQRLRLEIKEVSDAAESFNSKLSSFITAGAVIPQIAGLLPEKGVEKVLKSNALKNVGGLATKGGAAGTALTAVLAAGSEFAKNQVSDSLSSLSDQNFTKKSISKEYAKLFNPIETVQNIWNDEGNGILKKLGKTALVSSGIDTFMKSVSFAGAAVADVDTAPFREFALGSKTRKQIRRNGLTDINSPEEAEANRARIIAGREREANIGFSKNFKTLSKLSSLSESDAIFNKKGFGGGRSKLSRKIALNQLDTNIKSQTSLEKIQSEKRKQIIDTKLKREAASLDFGDAIKVFNNEINERIGEFSKGGNVTDRTLAGQIEAARETDSYVRFLSKALENAREVLETESDPKKVKEAFASARSTIQGTLNKNAITEEQAKNFNELLSNTLEKQSSILENDIIERKQLQLESVKAQLKVNQDFVAKLKQSFESNLTGLDSNNTSSGVVGDFRKAKTRSERDQLLKGLGVNEQGRYSAANAERGTSQFGLAAIQGAGQGFFDEIKKLQKEDPEQASKTLNRDFSKGQKQVLEDSIKGFDVKSITDSIFKLKGADTGQRTSRGSKSFLGENEALRLGSSLDSILDLDKISDVKDVGNAITALKSLFANVGALKGDESQTKIQNDVLVQGAAIIQKLSQATGVTQLDKGFQQKQLDLLTQIAQNTANVIAEKGDGTSNAANSTPDQTPAVSAAQKSKSGYNLPPNQEKMFNRLARLEELEKRNKEAQKSVEAGEPITSNLNKSGIIKPEEMEETYARLRDTLDASADELSKFTKKLVGSFASQTANPE